MKKANQQYKSWEIILIVALVALIIYFTLIKQLPVRWI